MLLGGAESGLKQGERRPGWTNGVTRETQGVDDALLSSGFGWRVASCDGKAACTERDSRRAVDGGDDGNRFLKQSIKRDR